MARRSNYVNPPKKKTRSEKGTCIWGMTKKEIKSYQAFMKKHKHITGNWKQQRDTNKKAQVDEQV